MSDNFEDLVKNLVTKCISLKNKYVKEKDLVADWICFFAQSEEEYQELMKLASDYGHVVKDTDSGPIYRFDKQIHTEAGVPNVVKVRKPDITKPELGDVDFNTSYVEFKDKYLDNKRFTLIVRDKFEMMELKEEGWDVMCYFSSVPPSSLVD
jgi:hypothetical protein